MEEMAKKEQQVPSGPKIEGRSNQAIAYNFLAESLKIFSKYFEINHK